MEKIIIISLAGVGDTIMATPTIKTIREIYPEAEISLLTFPYGNKEILDGSPFINETFIFKDRNHTLTKKKPPIIDLFKTLFLLLKLRFRRYDLSVSLYPSSSEKLATIAKIIHAKQRIGFDHRYYTNPVPLNTNIHRVERSHQLLTPLGIKIIDKKQFVPLTEENEKFAEEFLKDKGDLFVGMHPSGYWKTSYKHWGLENFAKLADLIHKNFRARIIVFEGPSDEGDGEKMKSLMKESQPIIINTTLKNVASVIKRCRLFISNDTGIMHLAEAVGTPTIDVGGWVEPEAGPYLKTNKLFISKDLPCYADCWIRKTGGKEGLKCDLRCFSDIRVEDVYKEAEKMLKMNYQKSYQKSKSLSLKRI